MNIIFVEYYSGKHGEGRKRKAKGIIVLDDNCKEEDERMLVHWREVTG